MKVIWNKKGFTLVELLVVIAIISLLATIGLVYLQNARTEANNAQGAAWAKDLYTAFHLYASDHDGAFPQSRCQGKAPMCIKASIQGDPSSMFCKMSDNKRGCSYDGGAGPCPVTPYWAPHFRYRMKPYLFDIKYRIMYSPVKDSGLSGYDSFLYISHGVPPDGLEGAYVAWFKDGCREFDTGECQGILLSSNCGSSKNGCAIYIGKSSEPAGSLECIGEDTKTFF